MTNFLHTLESFMAHFQSLIGFTLDDLVRAIILIFAGYIIAKIFSAAARKTFLKFTPQYQSKLIIRIIFYLTFILFCITALQHLGFKLNILLGAAGILTVALGFASQTSVSNIISGLFLIGEQPFVVGDNIRIDNTGGEVISIDLLSVKIRTNDNRLLRIPNEVLIKSTITNNTRFPIRRFDLKLGVSYGSDLGKIKEVLFKLADQNMLCMEEPKPTVDIINLGDSAIYLQFSVWATQQNYLKLQNSIQEQVLIAFEKNHIEMPFPQLTISTDTPLPLNLTAASTPNHHSD